jgi:sulfite exporter TauE/SafE
MSDASAIVSLSAALVAGAAGSAHCVAMCGGLAGALSLRSSNLTWPRTMRNSGLHHVGRLSGYAAAGALFGSLGTVLQPISNVPMLIVAVRVAAALLLVLVAARVLVGWNTLAPIERLGGRFWRLIQPLMHRAIGTRSEAGNLLLGFLWGWLPCGLVYSMLLFAALSGSSLRGAAIMVAFGIGTLPAMLATSILASRAPQLMRWQGTRRAIGALLLVFGAWLGWAALASPEHLGHVHL